MKVKKTLAFWICLATAIVLGVGGFFVPPLGVIDGSVLTYSGILLAFSAVGQLPAVIGEVAQARITKGDMTIEVSKHEKNPCKSEDLPLEDLEG